MRRAIPCLLEDLAKRWVPGGGPVQIEPLAYGLVNRSYRVTRDGRHYSLRLDTADARLGLDRRWECRIRVPAAAAGIAATVHHCNPTEGILIADWATGRCWTSQECRLPANIEAMAQLLRRVHSLTIPEPARRMSPAGWIAQYAPAAGTHCAAASADRDALRAAAEVHLATLGPAAMWTLCHSDLHRLNVLHGEGRLLLLDWEYAHVSEPLWDLAGWISNNDWSGALVEELLSSYRQGRVRREDPGRLQHLLWLYDYVCVLWSDLYAEQRPGLASEAVRVRAEALTTRLARASGSRAG